MFSDKFINRIRAKQSPMMPRLKPCPFCGSTRIFIKPYWLVQCGSCTGNTGVYKYRNDAIQAWNERKV